MRYWCSIVILLALISAPSPGAEPKPPHVVWDSKSMVLVAGGGTYGRMIRDGTSILCALEHNRHVKIRRSDDDGKTWSAEIDAAGYEFGNAANPEMTVTKAGTILLFYNGRPRQAGKPFTIGMATSRDHGQTWTSRPTPIFTAGTGKNEGCYEPAAIQQPDGEIDLFFANEFPHHADGQQEISICKSTDDGKTWTVPATASFRPHGRDGMPVPLRLLSGRTVISIEDNGGHPLQPAVIESPSAKGWIGATVAGDSPHRWAAGGFPAKQYAGAPYLRQMPDGTTILSCQPEDENHLQRMTVLVGDAAAKHFGGASQPFPTDEGKGAQWASVFVKNPTTVTAVATTTINGVGGIWAIDGRVGRE